MLSGHLPFKIIPGEKITKNIFKKRIKMFKHFSKNAENLIKRLLEYNQKKRITYDGIIKHPFFKGTNFDKIERLKKIHLLFQKSEMIIYSNVSIAKKIYMMNMLHKKKGIEL